MRDYNLRNGLERESLVEKMFPFSLNKSLREHSSVMDLGMMTVNIVISVMSKH